MKALKKFRNYIYGVRFLIEAGANTLVCQLNLAANDLPWALVTWWIVWIRLVNLDVKHVRGRLNGGPDGLSGRPQGEGEPEPEEEDDIEETVEASLSGIQVERGPQWKKRARVYQPFVGFRLAEEYKASWKVIAEYLGNMKRPERNTRKEMQQFQWEIMIYLGSDGILYQRTRNQWSAGNGVSECGADKESDRSYTPTQQAPWQSRNVTTGSGAVLVAGNLCQRQRLGENIPAVRKERSSTLWWDPDKPNRQSPKIASRDGYFVHAHNGGWISPTSGSLVISQPVGRGTTT